MRMCFSRYGAFLIPLLGVSAACLDAPVVTVSCEEQTSVDGGIGDGALYSGFHAPAPGAEVSATLMVTGGLRSPRGLAIRGVHVDGFPAKAVGENFLRWEAEIPHSYLAQRAGDDGTGDVVLTASYTDPCDTDQAFATLSVVVVSADDADAGSVGNDAGETGASDNLDAGDSGGADGGIDAGGADGSADAGGADLGDGGA